MYFFGTLSEVRDNFDLERALTVLDEPVIEVTEKAIDHFQQLLKEEEPGMNLRIFVTEPETPHAEVGISYCPEAEAEKTDIVQNLGNFNLYIEKLSLHALREARIDFKAGDLGGQVSVKAPHIKGQAPGDDKPIFQRIDYVIQTEINPSLASHGGVVSLEDFTDEGVVLLRFGGGCHGCGMVNVTLQHGIEKTLKDKFPEITAVQDITKHEEGANPYYE